MVGHDIIVIGASAGGLKAVSTLLAALPTDLKASVFVVQHMAPSSPSLLAEILGSVSTLPVSQARDHQPVERGHVYVARPDYHLLLNPGYLRVVRGPQENRFRPAIDALFRSAARAYGPRVVAVVLTGYLDDGTVGLQAVKKLGGIAVVQDPKDAEQPGMPRNALRYVHCDYVLPLNEIPARLVNLVGEAILEKADRAIPRDIQFESLIAEQQLNTEEFLENVEAIGKRTTYTCPECGGSIWQIGAENLLRFRCHVGHSYTDLVFLAEQTQHVEDVLWATVRALEEKVTFVRQLATLLEKEHSHQAAQEHRAYADRVDGEVKIIRELILHGNATQRTIGIESEVGEDG